MKRAILIGLFTLAAIATQGGTVLAQHAGHGGHQGDGGGGSSRQSETVPAIGPQRSVVGL